MKITHKISMDLDRYSVPGFDAVCGDRNSRELEIGLYAGGAAWEVPAEASATIRYQKPDGTAGSYDLLPDGTAAWGISGNVVTVMVAPQALTVPGCVILTVCLTAGDREISTFQILMNVRPAVGMVPADSGDYWYLSGSLPQPENAVAGEVLVVESVDSRGRVTALKTAGAPGMSPSQVSALEALLKLAVFREDPTEAWQAFQVAFGSTVPAAGISLSSMIYSTNVIGATKQLTATVTPENTTDEVVWESSDEAVAIVENGLVTTVGTGSCTITATAGPVSAQCSVTVTASLVHTHSYPSSVTTAATCETAGVRTYTCSCGHSYTEEIPATGHSYVDGVCVNCGAADPDHEEDVTLTGISATYSGGDVTAGTDVSALTGIVVTAHYSDGTSNAVTGYTLSGTIAEGENTITVSYGGMTASFTVTGVAESGTLLYNWDFTTSLTDTVSGLTAAAEVSTKSDGCGEVPVQDASGVHFTGIGQALGFGSIFALNRTYEIDVSALEYAGSESYNMRFFTLWQGMGSDTVSGFLFRHTYNYWSIYNGSWAATPYDITDRNAFAGKTVTLKIAGDGACELLLDGVSYGTCDRKFTAGWAVLQLGSSAIDGGGSAANMGGNLYNCTITGFRIYQGVE